MSTQKLAVLTERQLDLITRALCDSNGLIEPLLKLKGGAKLKMIASLSQRGMIERIDGQWQLTSAAKAIVKGDAPAAAPPSAETDVPEPVDFDPAIDAEVNAAEAAWQAERQTEPQARSAPRARQNSKQATVVEMLKRPEGATIAQVMTETGWLAHTIRGCFAGALKKKLGLTIVSEKVEGANGQRIYRIGQTAQTA